MGTLNAPLMEPVVVQDVYISGMSEPENIGDGNYRFTFYCNHHNIAGDMERVLVERLVMSETVARAVGLLGNLFTRDCADCLKLRAH